MQATLNPVSPVQDSIRAPQPVTRNIAVDAYRGWVMLLMMAEVLELARVAHAFPGNWFWAFLGYNQTHVEWSGCSLHDMIPVSYTHLDVYKRQIRLGTTGSSASTWVPSMCRRACAT